LPKHKKEKKRSLQVIVGYQKRNVCYLSERIGDLFTFIYVLKLAMFIDL
jgi:hypothetical protein